MTKLDLSQIKPIPGFDSLKWKQKVHAQILRETKGMTNEQIRERRRKISEKLRQEREQYWAEQAKLAETGMSDN